MTGRKVASSWLLLLLEELRFLFFFPLLGPFRYLRIAQNGKNSSGQTCYLSVSGFEVYGEIVDAVIDGFTVVKEEKDRSGCSLVSCIT